MTRVRVNRRGSDRVHAGHPWIFASDVVDRGQASPGEAVEVADAKGRALGTAHYSSTSQICLRFLSREVVEIGPEFFRARLEAALAFRRSVVSNSDCCRLVHAEADLLPGLVVDRYADWVVVQTLTQGMDRAKDLIIDEVRRLIRPAGIVIRNDAAVRAKEKLPLETTVLGADPLVDVRINGLRFRADLAGGQKTGIYLDQRENYAASATYGRGRALDLFTSTGGFALHLFSRCDSVVAIDSSARALETARDNQRNNAAANIDFRQADVFDFLAGQAAAGQRFDTVVLDPPAFAKTRGAIDGAARGYREINLRALQLLSARGVLITCSCSHHVSEAMLLEIVAAASLDAGRSLRVLERRTQAQDHPILLTVPETHYLKCLILQAV
ncbi:MAG: class I SAM-dependent rRNA methyltransferase [Bryobacteraceae bacterium]